MKAQATLFDRDLDEKVNGAKARELHAYHVACWWLVISPIEAQALRQGVVSTEILKQLATLLDPDPTDPIVE